MTPSRAADLTGHELFALIAAGLGPEAHRHRGIDAPGRRDTVIAGGSYRAPGTLVDGVRAGDGDRPVTGVAVAARASTAVLRRAIASGANMVISRQAFLGDSQDRPVAKPEPALAEKIALIEASGIAVLRVQDPRTGPAGVAVTTAFSDTLGLGARDERVNLADGLVYPAARRPIIDVVRRAKAALGTGTVRLVGDAGRTAAGVALATETNRPNALAPLIARRDVDLMIAGEVHETETTAYVLDAIALGQRKALLLVGAIAMEEPAARALAQWLASRLAVPVRYLPSDEGLGEVA